MSKAGSRILGSVRKARAFARGEDAEGFVLHVPEAIDVKAIRGKLGLSQEAFASRFGFSAAAVRDWEQGRAEPDQPTRAYLTLIARDPEHVNRILNTASR